MKVILTNKQHNSIIAENTKKRMNIEIQSLKMFAQESIQKIQEDLKLHFRLLFTWGAAVGGFIGPLNEFIENGSFELNSFQVTSILVATAAILFNENQRSIKKLLDLIKKEGISDAFEKVLEKGKELKNVFISFIESLNVTMYSLTNIMSYAFLIPILPKLWEISQGNFTKSDVSEISIRLLSFGLAAVTSVFLKKLISAIINRFK